MTFSVVAFDPKDRKWGVGVASRFLSVGSVVPWARAGIGCIATQSYANYSYGPEGLELLKQYSSKDTIEALTSKDSDAARRQVAAIDSSGTPYAYTGSKCMDYAGHIVGKNFSVQGNILAGPSVLEGMSEEMAKEGKLEERILSAMYSAEKQGGDRRGRQSACIFIVSENEHFEEGSDVYMDIRVEDAKEPIPELNRIMEVWMATFFEREFVNISDHQKELDDAIKLSGFESLEKLAESRRVEFNINDGKIGKYSLKVITSDLW